MSMRCMVAAGIVGAALLAGCGGGTSARSGTALQTNADRIEEARRLSGEALRAQKAGERDRAIELYRESLSVSGDLYFVWSNLGTLLQERGEYMDAVAAYQRAADLELRDPRPLENIGTVYGELGWEERALEFYLKALARDGRSVQALRGAVRAAKLLGTADPEALDRVRTAMMVDADPDWRSIYASEQQRIAAQVAQSSRRRR